ncbi:hypothetical protein KY285_021261 [Solanum tuberosum]|nr:hypothetical protein KY285_021261 [Solanum tuberosum]
MDGQGANTTTSALSKLTNRLNFLKERRTQIASELQHLDKNQSDRPVKNNGKVQTSEKNGLDDGQSLQHSDQGTKKEVHPNLDKVKSDSLPKTEKGQAVVPPRTNSR